MADAATLSILGFEQQPVPNRFLHPDRPTDGLAVLLPGFGYTLDMPLFYYAENLLLERGWDVLRVEYAYNTLPEKEVSPRSRMAGRLFADTTAAWRVAIGHRAYARVALIGKSLGTLAMGNLLTAADRPAGVRAIWLTPLLSREALRTEIVTFGGPSLFVIGTADEEYDAAALAALTAATNGEKVVVEGADHGMDIPGDAVASVHGLERAVEAIARFI